jgi:hypothetical protein
VPEIQEFRNARLILDSKNLTFVVQARIEERWETVAIPVYLDSPMIRTLPTLKRLTARIRKRYQDETTLHSALDGSPVTLVFEPGVEAIIFWEARIIEWSVSGQLDGEMVEEVVLAQ